MENLFPSRHPPVETTRRNLGHGGCNNVAHLSLNTQHYCFSVGVGRGNDDPTNDFLQPRRHRKTRSDDPRVFLSRRPRLQPRASAIIFTRDFGADCRRRWPALACPTSTEDFLETLPFFFFFHWRQRNPSASTTLSFDFASFFLVFSPTRTCSPPLRCP